MDGLRMLDEWRALGDAVPSDDSVFQRIGQLKAYQARVGESAEMENAARIFRLVDGRLTARRLIDLSRLGNFEATRVLAELRRRGLIELVEGKRARMARRGEKPPRVPILPILKVELATTMPILLLAAGVYGVATYGPAAQPLAGQPLPSRPLVEIRHPMERRALRSAIAADAYASGFTGRATELGESPGEGPLRWVSLTPDEAREYYYRQSEGKTLLLAPRR